MAKLKTGRHTGAIKAARQAKKRESFNRGVLKQVKHSAKELLSSISAKDAGKCKENLNIVYAKLDKAAKSGVMHWKTAARKKSRLTKLAAKPAK